MLRSRATLVNAISPSLSFSFNPFFPPTSSFSSLLSIPHLCPRVVSSALLFPCRRREISSELDSLSSRYLAGIRSCGPAGAEHAMATLLRAAENEAARTVTSVREEHLGSILRAVEQSLAAVLRVVQSCEPHSDEGARIVLGYIVYIGKG